LKKVETKKEVKRNDTDRKGITETEGKEKKETKKIGERIDDTE